MSGKKRKEMVPVIVVILLIVLVGCVGALTAVIKRMTPSDYHTPLSNLATL